MEGVRLHLYNTESKQEKAVRDVAWCFVQRCPPKMPILAILAVDVKHFKKSLKCFATEWEMCLPHLKAGVRIDDKINFDNPYELLSNSPRCSFFSHAMCRSGENKSFHLDMDTCAVSNVVGQDLCEYPEAAWNLCEQDDKEVVTTFYELCTALVLQGQSCCRIFVGHSCGWTLDDC